MADIIIPTYNRPIILKENLEALVSILNELKIEVKLIVVNDYKDHDDSLLIDTPFRIYVVNNPKQGVSSARNYGAELAKSENLIFADDDILITKDALAAALEFFESSKENLVLNTDWVYPDTLNQIAKKTNFGRFLISRNLNTLKGWMGAASNWRPNSIFQVSGAASYFLAIRKDTFKRVGGYNEDFPYAGFEDGEFADRLRKEGINTMLNTKVCVYHNESDRLDMKSWLDRKFREGVTRKVSVKLGNARYELNLSKFKKTVFEMLHYFRAPLIALIRISNHKLLDGLSFKLIRSLEGAHIWKGYSQNQQT